jgi:hypothetical protein
LENPTIYNLGNWKPNPNPTIYKLESQAQSNDLQIGNTNTNELVIKPTICNLETPISSTTNYTLHLQHFENSTIDHIHTFGPTMEL